MIYRYTAWCQKNRPKNSLPSLLSNTVMGWEDSITWRSTLLTALTLVFAIAYGLLLAGQFGVSLDRQAQLTVEILGGIFLGGLLIASWAMFRLESYLGPRD